jgi:D-alanyl-D-alanine carboxypeptidase/D-alanyl-D-alanine-endopeptidase (penicillin-binding protein 4)
MIYKFLFFILFPLFIKGQLNAIREDWAKQSGLKNASIAYCIVNIASGELVSEFNSHQALVPASTLKIVTTSAALALLGNEFTYETKIYFTGNFDKNSGILNGDLIIYGSGDPTLQSEHFYKDSESVLLKWASVLKEKGLKEIKGKICADASYFERKIPDNWIWEDISNYYGAVPCGLSYKDNKFKLTYSSGEKQSKAKLLAVSPDYFTHRLTIQSEVFANGTKDEAYAYGDPFSFNKEIRGSIPVNKKQYDIEVALPDPALLCAEHLVKALQQVGIRCDSNAVVSNYHKNDIQVNKLLIYTHHSPPLSKMVYYTNQNSNNQYCESILYTLGNGSAEKGLLKVKTYWQQQGLDTSEIYMEDASGLGRINAITANFQAKALYTIAKNKNIYTAFNASLPLAGKQGSMSNLGKGSFIENNLRAKTGYMKRARSYCGYVQTKSGKELAFSLIFNNYTCSASEAKKQMEKFLIALAEL